MHAWLRRMAANSPTLALSQATTAGCCELIAEWKKASRRGRRSAEFRAGILRQIGALRLLGEPGAILIHWSKLDRIEAACRAPPRPSRRRRSAMAAPPTPASQAPAGGLLYPNTLSELGYSQVEQKADHPLVLQRFS
ncbi:hypothetical protein [Metallibacterium sp.]